MRRENETYATRRVLEAFNPEALLAEGLDDALVGTAWIRTRYVAVYGKQRIFRILQERDGMTADEAEEFFEFKIENAYVGPNGPIYIDMNGR